jgi:tetratricopeptide (TPR) repeat protein
MMKHVAVAGMILAASAGFAQEAGPDISRYLAQIEAGQVDQVRAEVPALLAQYPNTPAVLYLHAATTPDGAEAVRIYQSIFDNFPKSEWADDALYRVYQFYHAIGLYRTAEIKLNQLRQMYPKSKYVTQDVAADTRNLPEESMPAHIEPPKNEPEPLGVPTYKEEPTVVVFPYTLQVGAYTTQVNAEKQKLFFEDLGLPVEVINKVKNGRSLYLVLVGNFRTYDEAKAKGAEFKKRYNIDNLVVTR